MTEDFNVGDHVFIVAFDRHYPIDYGRIVGKITSEKHIGGNIITYISYWVQPRRENTSPHDTDPYFYTSESEYEASQLFKTHVGAMDCILKNRQKLKRNDS